MEQLAKLTQPVLTKPPFGGRRDRKSMLPASSLLHAPQSDSPSPFPSHHLACPPRSPSIVASSPIQCGQRGKFLPPSSGSSGWLNSQIDKRKPDLSWYTQEPHEHGPQRQGGKAGYM